MPLYYFDIRDAAGTHRDDVGVELSGIDAAIIEAKRTLSDMSREALVDGDNHDLEILIRDHGEGPIHLVLSLETRRPTTTKN